MPMRKEIIHIFENMTDPHLMVQFVSRQSNSEIYTFQQLIDYLSEEAQARWTNVISSVFTLK